MTQPQFGRVLSYLVVLTSIFLLVACAGAPAADLSARATVDALLTANAALSTQVAELAAAVATPTPAAAVAAATPTPATATVAPPADAAADAAPPPPAAIVSPAAPTVGGALPYLVADVPLAPAGETIYDLRVDRTTNQLFVTDSASQLHVLDATTYAPLATLPFGGWLELDAANRRLYVYNTTIVEGEEAVIHVVDTTQRIEVGQIPGRAIAVDSANNRLFVGEPYSVSTPEDASGVRIVDGATLQQTGVFTQPGTPRYNPARNELIIVAYTAYTADPATQQLTGDLFPELTDLEEIGFLWCNGCRWVDDVQYFAGSDLLAIPISAHCAGKGCGQVEAPRVLDAATLAPIAPADAPTVQAGCGSQVSLAGAVEGRYYRNTMYDRYVVFTNLMVEDEAGALLTWRDGLRVDFVNQQTGQGYLYDGVVVDLATLAPIGGWPASCVMAYEPATGLLFGRRSNNLRVIGETGGAAPPPAPAVVEDLPEALPIQSLAVSPDFATDSTVLAVTGASIYRSTDGGTGWMRLAGGLPDQDQGTWTVAFSPNYTADRTLYAAGYRGDYWGDGVWRSQDGGDSWQALWNNLIHRRVHTLHFSPDFAANNTLVAQARFFDVASAVGGESYQQSTDGGLNWTLVVTGNYTSPAGEVPLPPVSELLPGSSPVASLPVRVGSYGDILEFSPDGSSWQTATLGVAAPARLLRVVPSPGDPVDGTIYVFGNQGIWRTADGGATWERWNDTRLADMDYTNEISAGAVSPILPDGGRRILVGTAGGQVWALDAATLDWQPAPGTPAATAGMSATDTPTTEATTEATTEGTPPDAGLTLPTPTPGGAAPAAAAVALEGGPPEGLFRPEGSFAVMWENTARLQQDLGWARQAGPGTTAGAFQRFERGTMLWREDTGQIYTIFNDGSWQSFADTFEEGQPESDPNFAPPPGKQQPIRGFGRVWRENATVREKLGWAQAKEQGENLQVQNFERGVLLRLGGIVYAMLGVDVDKGRWY